jgi:hypothetical protein
MAKMAISTATRFIRVVIGRCDAVCANDISLTS